MISPKLLNYEDKIFVAGHSGMVGSSIVRVFKKNGYHNLLTVDRQKLNLLDPLSVESFFKKYQPKIVIIAATKVGGIEANNSYPVDFLMDNIKIQNNVIENAWKYRSRRLLFLGSSCIYPKFSNQPIKEDSLLTSSLEPTNEWYAIAKIAGLKLCEALRIQYGFDAITLMPTNLYGPGDNYHPKHSHVLPAMIRRFSNAVKEGESTLTCWGSGAPYREFLYVDDLAEACLFALNRWNPSFENAPKKLDGTPLTFLNVGTGIDIRIHELASKIAKLIGYKGNIEWDNSKPDGTPRKQLDVSHLLNLGWEPSISLEEGLRNTIKDYLEQLDNNTLRLN